MNNNHVYDMLVVGGGPGGYTAALYAARAGLDTIVLEKLSAGGQMALTEQIDNYPGFENGIDGFSLAENMQKQAERFGARSLRREKPFSFTTNPFVSIPEFPKYFGFCQTYSCILLSYML